MNELKTYRGKLLVREDLGLWEGDVAPIPDEVPAVDLRWKGGKLPARILHECLAWFRLVNEKYSSEAQARLFYNPTTGAWSWTAFPQWVTPGLYSKEVEDHELTDEQKAMRLRSIREMSEAGFTEAGTIHSHCDAGAFASWTDEKDEISQNGLHLTLGHISEAKVELHGRVVFRKVKYRVHWDDWLDGVASDTPESFRFEAQPAVIDEERLMALCAERKAPEPVSPSIPGFGVGGWHWGGREVLPQRYLRTPWDGEEDGEIPESAPRGEREEDEYLDSLAGEILDELAYGAGLDRATTAKFAGLFVERLLENECCGEDELLREVAHGFAEARDFLAAESIPGA